MQISMAMMIVVIIMGSRALLYLKPVDGTAVDE